MKVEYENTGQKGPGRRHKVNVNQKLDTYSLKLFGMTTKFESRWDGGLGCIIGAKHCHELTSDKIRAVQCVTYRAGPRARAFEQTEIENVLRMVAD